MTKQTTQISVGDRLTHRDMCGWFDGTIVSVDAAGESVLVQFDDESVGDETLTIKAALSGKRKYGVTHPAPPVAAAATPKPPTPAKRGSWSRGTQTEPDEAAVSEAFEARSRFERELRDHLDRDIQGRLDSLRQNILGNVLGTYDEALWRPKVTRRFHKRMGFHSDHPVTGRSSRWSASTDDDDSTSQDDAQTRKKQRKH
jgi:hypothetical protein